MRNGYQLIKIIEYKKSMETLNEQSFWEKPKFLDKIKELNFYFYNIIKNGKNISMDIDENGLYLTIDGERYNMCVNSKNGEVYKINTPIENDGNVWKITTTIQK